MTTVQVREAATALHDGYAAPNAHASGGARSELFRPNGYSLWELEAYLDAGAVITWGADHGDEAVYVLEGTLEVEGQGRVSGRGAVIVEAGVVAAVRAVSPTRVLHYGPTSPEPPEDGPLGRPRTTGRGVHLISADEAGYEETPDGTRNSLHYLDSTCETCRVALFENGFREASVVGSHTHSQDEIIRLLSGEIQMGRVTLRAGMSAAIPGGQRYGFRSSGPFAFLNYRRDASLYVGTPGSDPLLETLETVRRVRSGTVID